MTNHGNVGPPQAMRQGLGSIGSGNTEIKKGKKIENLPRTGIEYPMMREQGHAPFIYNCPEKEPLVTGENCISNYLLDEYMRCE